MPVREPKKSAVSVMGYFVSIKNGRSIFFESTLERDCYLLFEFDDDVEKYEEQPFRVRRIVNGRERSFVPDCLLTYRPELDKKPLLVEIKTLKELKDEKKSEKLRIKISAIEEYAKANNMDFELMVDRDVRNQYLENLRFLYRYSAAPDGFSAYGERIADLLKTRKAMTVTDILDNVTPEKPGRTLALPSVWHLVFVRAVRTDLKVRLTNNSLMELNNEHAVF